MTLDIIVILTSLIGIVGLLTVHMLFALKRFGVFDAPDYADV